MYPFESPNMTPLEEAQEELEVLLDNGHDVDDPFVTEAKRKIAELGGPVG